jgi:hypothetical protein
VLGAEGVWLLLELALALYVVRDRLGVCVYAAVSNALPHGWVGRAWCCCMYVWRFQGPEHSIASSA